jgi:hypothetical protein
MTSSLRRLLALCVAYRALMGIFFALPLAAGVATLVGDHPVGDALLWERGGYWLVEVARLHRSEVAPALQRGGIATMVLALGWLVPEGALVIAVGAPGESARSSLRAALRRLGGLVLLFGVATVLETLVAGAAAYGFTKLSGGVAVRAPIAAVGFFLTLVCAVLHDVARVLLLQRGVRLAELPNRAIEAFLARPVAMLLAALWRALAAWALALAMLWSSATVVGFGDAGLALAVVAQLTAIAGYVSLRASWFRYVSERQAAADEDVVVQHEHLIEEVAEVAVELDRAK